MGITDDLASQQSQLSALQQEKAQLQLKLQRIFLEFRDEAAEKNQWKAKYEEERGENQRLRAVHTKEMRKAKDHYKFKTSQADSKAEMHKQRVHKLENAMSKKEIEMLNTLKENDHLSTDHNMLKVEHEDVAHKEETMRLKNDRLETVMDHTHLEVEKMLRALRTMESRFVGTKDRQMLEEEVEDLKRNLRNANNNAERQQHTIQANFQRYAAAIQEAQNKAEERVLERVGGQKAVLSMARQESSPEPAPARKKKRRSAEEIVRSRRCLMLSERSGPKYRIRPRR